MLNSVRHSVDLYCEVLLEHATRQLNWGGYEFWHAMIVDDSELGRSVFYAVLPNKSGANYRWANNVMK